MTYAEFEAAVKEHRSDLVRFAISKLRDEPTADDVVQQTLLELYQECGQFDVAGPASVKTWLMTRLKSRCVDEQRRRLECAVEPIHLHSFDEDNARDYEDERYTVADLLNAISECEAYRRLPEEMRGVVKACLFEGWTQKEAGKALGLSRDQVARKLARAKAILDREVVNFQSVEAPIIQRRVG
ncbi:MAG TPA: sigma-70 family RNA polymerase sigma factor [Nitrospiraceae bacterium]|nr:sigma-70 family RNA polymerase sigma factor [Nitrospiraceae bacterium]